MKILGSVIMLAATAASLSLSTAAADASLEQEVEAVIEDVIGW